MEEFAARWHVVPLRLGTQGRAQADQPGLRAADLDSEYLRAFIDTARDGADEEWAGRPARQLYRCSFAASCRPVTAATRPFVVTSRNDRGSILSRSIPSSTRPGRYAEPARNMGYVVAIPAAAASAIALLAMAAASGSRWRSQPPHHRGGARLHRQILLRLSQQRGRGRQP